MHLFPPVRFRFTDAADVAAYGDRWYVWDERAIAGLRARELVEIEQTIGMPIRAVFAGLRGNASTAATMAAMWITLHRAGHAVAWDDFDPVAHLTDWEAVPDPLASSGEGPAPDSDSSPAPQPSKESATS